MKVKKILLILFILLVTIIANINPVYASSCSINLSAEKENYAPGQTVVITVSASNIDCNEGLTGMEAFLEYDTSIFEPITNNAAGKITSTNSYITKVGNFSDGTFAFNSAYPLDDGTTANWFDIFTSDASKDAQDIVKITLKIKETATLGTAKVLLNDIKCYDYGDNTINTSPAALRINIKEGSSGGDDIPPIIKTPEPTSAPTSAPTKAPASTTTVPTATAKVTSTPSGNLPQTGISGYTVPVLIGAVVLCLVAYIAYRRYKDI